MRNTFILLSSIIEGEKVLRIAPFVHARITDNLFTDDKVLIASFFNLELLLNGLGSVSIFFRPVVFFLYKLVWFDLFQNLIFPEQPKKINENLIECLEPMYHNYNSYLLFSAKILKKILKRILKSLLLSEVT